jgi:hypothetical protein
MQDHPNVNASNDLNDGSQTRSNRGRIPRCVEFNTTGGWLSASREKEGFPPDLIYNLLTGQQVYEKSKNVWLKKYTSSA